MDILWLSLCMNALKTRGREAERERGRAQRDIDEKQREVSQSSPLLHGAYFQTALSINFMLLLFQKLYKYAEQSDDKIPIPGIAR